MRIGYLSSYPPLECGIATYTNYLRTAMSPRSADTFVVAPIGSEGPDVIPVYQNGSGAFAPDVYNVLMQRTPDIVHVQHEYGLFGPNRGMEIIDLVFRLRLIRVPVVITLHTVYESLSEEEEFMLGHLLAECAAVIVHEEFQRLTLERHLGPEIGKKIHVIDHGVREVQPIRDAKVQLDLEGKKVVMMLGYFRPTKGFHKVVDFLPQVCAADDDVVFVLAGKTRNIEYGDYRHQLLDQLRTSPYADRIVMLQGQFAQPTFDTTLSAADVVVLPYDVGAQSGVLAQCLAFGRPIVTSKLRAFQNVTARSGAGVSCEEDQYGEQILRILQEPDVADRFTTNAQRYVRYRAGWSIVAERHESLYQDVLESRSDGRRFVHFYGEAQPLSRSLAEASPDVPADASEIFETSTTDQWMSKHEQV